MVARPPSTCLRCNGRLETGFTLDESHGTYHPSRWVEGEPAKSFWIGLKIRGRRKLAISIYRCRSCGLLEHYAAE